MSAPTSPGSAVSGPSAQSASDTALIRASKKRLPRSEHLILRIVRASLEEGLFDRAMRFCQRTVGQAWIHHSTKNLKQEYGLERSQILESPESVIVVANHRSFFDLYVITASLVRRGLPHRILFPVRADFFFTSWLGLLVNFFMSFLSMYPPLYRQRERLALNLASLDELGALLRKRQLFVGLHPEGTRKLDDDPYTFLPARPGVGRVIHEAGVRVVPVFIRGLKNDLWAQVKGNFTGRGEPIRIVYGAPIDFGDLLAQPSSKKVQAAISERCMAEIARLAEEERTLPTPFN